MRPRAPPCPVCAAPAEWGPPGPGAGGRCPAGWWRPGWCPGRGGAASPPRFSQGWRPPGSCGRSPWGRGCVGTGGGLWPLPCVAPAAWAPGSRGEACVRRGVGAVRGGRPWGLRVWFRAGGGQCLCRGHSGIKGGPGALGLALCPRRSITPISRHTLAPGGSWAADMGKPGSPGARTYAVPSAQSPRSRHLPPRAGPELPSLCPRMAWAELHRGAGGWT